MGRIPELEGEPELRLLIGTVNQTIQYKTAGCLVSAAPTTNEVFPYMAFSYVHVCFDDVLRNRSKGPFEEMCEAFKLFVADFAAAVVGSGTLHYQILAGEPVLVDFEIHRADFHDPNRINNWVVNGWVTTIYVYGYGTTNSDAKNFWRIGIAALTAFFTSRFSQLPPS